VKLGHHEFIQRVQEIEIAPLDGTGPLLRLCASVEAHPSEPPGPGRHRGATTLAIRMDQAAARTLVQQIFEDSSENGLAAATKRRKPSLKALARGFGIDSTREPHMFAEWAIFLAIVTSGVFICKILKEIAEQLLHIRVACAGIDARGRMAAEDRAREWLTAREKRGDAQSPPVVS
jgi:hypothetical protein